MALSNEESAYVRKLVDKLADLEAKFQSVKIQANLPQVSSEQFSGKGIPHTEGVEIAIPATTNPVQGNITFNEDGQFIAQRIHFAWRQNSYNPAFFSSINRFRPISDVHNYHLSPNTDVINFYWEYYVSGSKRYRQNIPVPSACVDRAEEGNGAWEFAVNDAFPSGSTITVKITPSLAPEHAGIMYVAFHGCYLLK